MIMECIECHHLADASEIGCHPSEGYECPACGGPFLIYRMDLQRSPEGRIIPCPGNLGEVGDFPDLPKLPELDQDIPEKL